MLTFQGSASEDLIQRYETLTIYCSASNLLSARLPNFNRFRSHHEPDYVPCHDASRTALTWKQPGLNKWVAPSSDNAEAHR